MTAGRLASRGALREAYSAHLPIKEEALVEAYHAAQIGTFAATAADLVTAITMTNTSEAIGVTRAAMAAGLPVVISFTVETDGKLPTGQPLQEAIQEVDAATGRAPAYYMINCAHPSHFAAVLDEQAWLARLRGLRANASKRSHAEIDEAAELTGPHEGSPSRSSPSSGERARRACS